jgi:hypothetical protein
MNDAPLLTGSVADALRRGRDRYNTKFALARRTYATLEGAALGEHLRANVVPIVARIAPDAVDETFDALYDISLELIGKELFGAQPRYPLMLAGWRRLLPAVPQLLVAEPRRVAGAVTNALYNLATQPAARADEWLAAMERLGPACADVNSFLSLGQVAAWRAGLAHYREGGLEQARSLPETLARQVLGLAEDAPLEAALARLAADPWLKPPRMNGAEKRLQVVSAVGAFRGFGGVFLCPPTVVCDDGQFIVSDAENSWLLTADACGATLHRLGPAQPPRDATNPRFNINGLGKVVKDNHSFQFPWLAGHTSQAANETTLAVTLPLSHSVFLVALAGG